MNLLKEHLLYIQEQTNRVIYHGSHIQNLKVIEPKGSTADQIKYSKRVWGTDNKKFAAVFTMPWLKMFLKGINCKTKNERDQTNCETWDMEINTRNKWLFDNQPCSIYTITARNWIKPPVSIVKKIFSKKYKAENLPEYYTFSKAKVMKEEKYKSIKQCFIKNGIRFHFDGITANTKGVKDSWF